MPIGDDETPMDQGPLPVPAGITRLAFAPLGLCGLDADGGALCWGHAGAGSLGHGDDAAHPDPGSSSPLSVGGDVVQLVTGWRHMCALLDGGTVRCWGDNFYGQLGLGHQQAIGDDELPSEVGPVETGSAVIDISAGGDVTCAVLEGGSALCWGHRLALDWEENVGDDEAPDDSVPIAFDHPIASIHVGGWGGYDESPHHACAVLTDESVRCWGGKKVSGQVGRPSAPDQAKPTDEPVILGGSAVELVTGGVHSCARLEEGNVRCWGANMFGELGYGHLEPIGDDETPDTAGDVDIGGRAVGLAAGAVHSCALREDGEILCWGRGSRGALGYGTTDDVGDDETPVDVGPVQLPGG